MESVNVPPLEIQGLASDRPHRGLGHPRRRQKHLENSLNGQ